MSKLSNSLVVLLSLYLNDLVQKWELISMEGGSQNDTATPSNIRVNCQGEVSLLYTLQEQHIKGFSSQMLYSSTLSNNLTVGVELFMYLSHLTD